MRGLRHRASRSHNHIMLNSRPQSARLFCKRGAALCLAGAQQNCAALCGYQTDDFAQTIPGCHDFCKFRVVFFVLFQRSGSVHSASLHAHHHAYFVQAIAMSSPLHSAALHSGRSLRSLHFITLCSIPVENMAIAFSEKNYTPQQKSRQPYRER